MSTQGLVVIGISVTVLLGIILFYFWSQKNKQSKPSKPTNFSVSAVPTPYVPPAMPLPAAPATPPVPPSPPVNKPYRLTALKITHTRSEYINIADISFFDDGEKVKVSPDQVEVVPPLNGPSWLKFWQGGLVDGNLDGLSWGATENTPGAYLKINMPSPTPVTRIVIDNTKNIQGDRIVGAVLGLEGEAGPLTFSFTVRKDRYTFGVSVNDSGTATIVEQ